MPEAKPTSPQTFPLVVPHDAHVTLEVIYSLLCSICSKHQIITKKRQESYCLTY
jgi:hypothetical protein